MRQFASIAFLALLLGCGGNASLLLDPDRGRLVESAITLRLDKSEYRVGELVTLTMTNASDRSYGYNLCGRAYDRRVATGWVAMPEELRMCTAHLDALPPGATRTGRTDLHSDATPGTYRMVVTFLASTGPDAGSSVVAVSPAFTIR
jgi:hypothetical protein